ncbi:hypothetical protein F5B18DRAFT_636931 [Nemania serpens]|nr:hypothetical protein F5B18DRAFT_636931 [Nemania serpens]
MIQSIHYTTQYVHCPQNSQNFELHLTRTILSRILLGAMTGLLQLPNEVLAIIWDELDAQGFSALRLASKYANSATLSAFTRQYFKTRYVMLSRLSLENTVEIARHPVFSPAVRTLEICTDHFHQFPDSYFHTTRHEGDMILAIQEGRCLPAVIVDRYSPSEEEGQSPREEGQEGDEGSPSLQDTHVAPVDEVAYKSLWEEQEQIIMPGLAQAYITQALIALTNVEAVVISSMHRPWGALVHGRQTGRPPTNAVEDFEAVPFIGRVLRITLTAIATSGAALRSLAVTVGLSWETITTDILRLSEAHLQYYKSLPPSLTELTLNISAEGKRGAEDRWADDLLTFIGMFRQLTQLDLVITPDRFGPQVNRLKELVPKLQLSNLQCFGLYRVYCSVQDLAMLIMKHKATLQSVTLVRVRTSGGISDWKFLFALIRDHLPRLELSIQLCIAKGFVLLYQAEHKDGEEEFEHDFDVGGNHESWTTAIQAVEAGHWPL